MRLNRWLGRPVGDSPILLLILDGVNERGRPDQCPRAYAPDQTVYHARVHGRIRREAGRDRQVDPAEGDVVRPGAP